MKILDAYLSRQYGSARPFAEALGVSQSALAQVRSGQRPMPIDWMERIEKYTNGKLTVEAMVRAASRARREARKAKAE